MIALMRFFTCTVDVFAHLSSRGTVAECCSQWHLSLLSGGCREGAPAADHNSPLETWQNVLFPRGTNPFATVKLKPTHTNDRSAPVLHRR
ncbi:hypothetical protein AMECASPLE_037963 [Ameca splendens]|uniref:Secreted protein n=1 Tax=Ameca splendens TaxID=208324 RepID=A0ABV1AFE9_9TELE